MPTKSDEAYKFLRTNIISAAIQPDMPLRIQSLGIETGFGSTPVREALRRPEAERLVVSEVNCGFRSAPIYLEQLRDLEKSRLVLEVNLLKDSILMGDDQWESEIVAAQYQLAKLENPVDTDDQHALNHWSQKHEGFHDALLCAATSYWLRSFRKQISEQLERHFHYTLGGPLRHKFQDNTDSRDILRRALGIEHHTALMEATLNRDVDKAVELLTKHIRFASGAFNDVFA